MICPNCKSDQMAGTLFCSECGIQLVTAGDTLTTQKINTDGMSGLKNVSKKQDIKIDSDAWGSLHLIESGQVLPLGGRNEFTIGRVSDAQPIMPDIDLSTYHAYESGVSRLHAILKLVRGKAVIMDLGSANGTYLNGSRLDPHIEYSIHTGDMLSIGKLKLQLLIK